MRSKRRWFIAGLIAVLIAVTLFVNFKGIVFTRIHPAYLFLESQRIQRGVSDFDTLHQEGFNIRYRQEDSEAALEVMNIAEAWSPSVLDFFDYNTANDVDIVLFSREEELKGALRIPENQSAMGAYAGGKINLLSSETFIDQGSDSMTNVYVHELAHLAVDGVAKGNYPLWFTEGSALYMEYLLLDYEWGSDLQDIEAYTVDDLTNRFSSLDEQMAYRQSFLLVKGLIEEFGRDSYVNLLKLLGSGMDFEQALTENYGITGWQLGNYLGL